jgi:hypothetical protein
MGKNWTDRGNGQWKLTVTSDMAGDSTPPVVLYGTKDEILDKLADSKINGDRRINELRRGYPSNGAAPAAAATVPRPLTPAERMQTVADLANPATVDRAVTRVMESVIGPVEGMREDRAQERAERETRDAVEAAKQFAEATPDWYPSQHNKNTLVGYMQRMGLNASNTQDYTTAFEELTAAHLLQIKPAEDDETEPPAQRQERTAPTPAAAPKAPTRYSTGVRQSDISGTPPRPTTRLKYTREQIARMGAAAYKQAMLSDPELSRSVEYYAQQDRQKRRAS